MSRRKRIYLIGAAIILLGGIYFLPTREDPNLLRLDAILKEAAEKTQAKADAAAAQGQPDDEELTLELIVALIPPSRDGKQAGGILEDAPEVIDLLKKLREAGEVELLSLPKVSTVSGGPFTIQTNGGQVQLVRSYGKPIKMQVGTSIRCLPSMTANGDVLVDLRLDNCHVDPAASFQVPAGKAVIVPSFSTQSMAASFRVPLRKTFYLSGLKHMAKLQRVANIPCDLPLIGPLFSYTYTTETDRETLVLASVRRAANDQVSLKPPAFKSITPSRIAP